MRLHQGAKSKQRGITFIGLLFVAAIVGFSLIVVAKVVPTVIEYQAIVKAINKAKQHETVADIERDFTAAQAIDDFTSVQASDLIITKENDEVKIEFAYDKEIKLVGPVSLLIHYSGSTK